MNKIVLVFFSSIALATLTNFSVQALTIDSLDFIGQATLSGETMFEATTVGGLSGITYNPDLNIYYSISDDRSQVNPARFYTLNIDLSKFNSQQGTGGVTVAGVTSLLQNNQPFPANSLDPEGIALNKNGKVYISSEGEVSNTRLVNPFVNQFDLATGQQTQALSLPNKFLPNPPFPTTQGVRNNFGFESLTITPNQQYLLTATENALIQDGPAATANAGSPSRILKYDLTAGEAVGEYLYNTEPGTEQSPPPRGFFNSGLVELLAIDDSGKHFLALERSFFFSIGFTVKLYEISLENATNIQGIASLNTNGISGIVPVQKQLLLDLGTLGITLTNLEGMTFGPTLSDGRRSLILVADNNLSSSVPTQFIAFAINPQPVPEPLTILGTATAVSWGVFFKRHLGKRK